MPNPTAAMLVIGDEILSGRTRDANMHHLAQALAKVGIELREARVVGDRPEAIVAAVRELAAGHDHLFTSGGIGPTHDDITAESVAEAMAAPIGVRDDALAILQAHYERSGLELNDARRRMARVPEGATLIDNPVSAAPGFTLGNVHVMAGVPTIFEAMVASVLPTLTGGAPLLSQSLRIERGEGDIAGPLTALAADFPDLAIGSYPFNQAGLHGTNVVVRGTDGARLDAAMVRLSELFPMRLPDPAALFAASEATWPPVARRRVGGFVVRDGQGGGSRASAATAEGDAGAHDVAAAEAAMTALGQAPLFMVREGDAALDAILAARGYRVKDPVTAYAAPVAALATERPPPVTTFEVWPPLAVQAEIWAAGGIGPARLAVMARAGEPKATILGRHSDRPAATAFVAAHQGVGMLHALEVAERFRRRGLARQVMRAAAFWARGQGAEHLAVLVTRANIAANALYAALGMARVTGYHYRIRGEP